MHAVRRRLRGLTLLELTVALIFVGALILMALPAYSTVLHAAKVSGTQLRVREILEASWANRSVSDSFTWSRESVEVSVPKSVTLVWNPPLISQSDTQLAAGMDIATKSLSIALVVDTKACVLGTVTSDGVIRVMTVQNPPGGCTPGGMLIPVPVAPAA
jgi:type II secretory pathway pseudopilin PulG